MQPPGCVCCQHSASLVLGLKAPLIGVTNSPQCFLQQPRRCLADIPGAALKPRERGHTCPSRTAGSKAAHIVKPAVSDGRFLLMTPDLCCSGFSPASLQPSPSQAEAPTEQNSSSSLVPLVESLDSDLWEIQGESSGSPAGPSYSTPAVEAGSHAQTTTDPDVGLMHHWGRASGQTTPLPSTTSQEEEGLSQTSTDDSTAWAISVRPGHPFTNTNRARGTAPAGSKEGAADHVHQSHLTAVPPSSAFHSPSVAFSGVAWDEVAPTFQEDQEPELRHGGTELLSESKLHNTHLSPESLQVYFRDVMLYPMV